MTTCEERFGSHPIQVCTEKNRIRHNTGYEGDPRRRPFTREELQAFFDHADSESTGSGPVRPAFGFPDHPAVWVTERGSRLSGRALDDRFAAYRDALGLHSAGLTREMSHDPQDGRPVAPARADGHQVHVHDHRPL